MPGFHAGGGSVVFSSVMVKPSASSSALTPVKRYPSLRTNAYFVPGNSPSSRNRPWGSVEVATGSGPSPRLKTAAPAMGWPSEPTTRPARWPLVLIRTILPTSCVSPGLAGQSRRLGLVVPPGLDHDVVHQARPEAPEHEPAVLAGRVRLQDAADSTCPSIWAFSWHTGRFHHSVTLAPAIRLPLPSVAMPRIRTAYFGSTVSVSLPLTSLGWTTTAPSVVASPARAHSDSLSSGSS